MTNKKKTTYAIWIGDRSGSMSNLTESHKQGYNNFIKEQKNENSGDFFLTTIRFDDIIEIIGENVPIDKVPLATDETFKEGGSTALNDAIGKGIQIINKIYEKNMSSNKFCNYLIMIMTDGYENCSTKYTSEDIRQKIEECRKNDIGVNYIATNQNAEHTGSTIFGINKSNCLTFAPTPIGMTQLMRSVSSTVSNYRLTGNSEFSPEVKTALNTPINSESTMNPLFTMQSPPALNRKISTSIFNNKSNSSINPDCVKKLFT